MRVVVVTNVLLPSDVFSTSTKCSILNLHSLISGDTHDVVRALRVVDESDTQERFSPVNIESVMKFIPGTAAHTAAGVAEAAKIIKLKESLELTQLEPNDVNKRFESLLMNEHFNRRLFIECIENDIKPKKVKLLLLKHKLSENLIKPIMASYTKIYTDFEPISRNGRDAEVSVMKVRMNEAKMADK